MKFSLSVETLFKPKLYYFQPNYSEFETLSWQVSCLLEARSLIVGFNGWPSRPIRWSLANVMTSTLISHPVGFPCIYHFNFHPVPNDKNLASFPCHLVSLIYIYFLVFLYVCSCRSIVIPVLIRISLHHQSFYCLFL